ncbi:Crp/Fnr family transcriptional regulator [Listeria seeligeri]|uniref:Crp/Fnr family transcriptional regulator n=1 Tax=Listeria seeligeri TaxID=1640 RepID=UPI001625B561|nr:Crp/Fnr family transcriptional regulator [Listeria seeligeri]MBC1756438.1 Crp/Fnr family transcriptional regulator [Listeria seeligeri]MBC1815098.1 Crp/Fnr family transcriptional regulator [Listeria seeligeri]MBC2029479.1 Crp/Fnr family transcriptional regulator [Listeria seeligeri]MBC6113719.1 Crp/Fnr family transcriptional regulator [Listeria seeligeri]MBC6159820.1 Crp/Fnr family transcriptional regulator [Listeria seeligeri]
MEKQWEVILEDLERNKADNDWVTDETLLAGQTLENRHLLKHFLILEKGTLHLENQNSQILQFFTTGDIVFLSPYDMNVDTQLKLVCDQTAKIVFVDREYFLNFAANKASYMEWLLTSVLSNTSALCFELMKHDLPADERIVYTLQRLCKKTQPVAKEEYYEVPNFLNKTKMAQYGAMSRKNLYNKLEVLEESEQVKQKNEKVFVTSVAI